MPKLSLTSANIEFIKTNRLKMSGSEMAKIFGVNKQVVNRYMRTNGLTAPKEEIIRFRTTPNIGRTSFTKKEDDYIKKNYLNIPVKTLATKLNRSGCGVIGRIKRLGLKIPKELIEKRKSDSQYKKGRIPENKGKPMPEHVYEKAKHTMFKKGHLPKNTKEKDGEITIRHDHKNRNGKPYKWIRISIGKWVPLHQYLWVQKFGSYDSSTFCLWFKDGNTMNCGLDNLELITRADNARRNKNSFIELPDDVQIILKTINKLKKKIKQHEKQS